MGGRVNCTHCLSYNRAMIAFHTGVDYVNSFWGRIRDVGYVAASIVRQGRQIFDERGAPSEIIVASIRQINDVNEAFQSGADLVTVSPKLLPQPCARPNTDEAAREFMNHVQGWSAAESMNGQPILGPSGLTPSSSTRGAGGH